MSEKVKISKNVEETPEEMVSNIYHHWNDEDGPAIYSGQTIASIIHDVLDILNIKIEGINS